MAESDAPPSSSGSREKPVPGVPEIFVHILQCKAQNAPSKKIYQHGVSDVEQEIHQVIAEYIVSGDIIIYSEREIAERPSLVRAAGGSGQRVLGQLDHVGIGIIRNIGQVIELKGHIE